MSVIRHTLPMSSSVSCFCDVSISGHLKCLPLGNEKVLLWLLFMGGEGLYWMGWSASNCREDENILSPSM